MLRCLCCDICVSVRLFCVCVLRVLSCKRVSFTTEGCVKAAACSSPSHTVLLHAIGNLPLANYASIAVLDVGHVFRPKV